MKLEPIKDKIIDLYKNNHSIRDISKLLNCSNSGIKRILHKYNVKMRNKCQSLNLCPKSFTNKELEFLVGTVLGDGHITINKKKGESHFYIGHSTKQKEYIEYKKKILTRWIGCKIYELKHKLGNKEHITLNFISRKSENFSLLRNKFYFCRKIIPISYLYKNFSEYSLAILYMDDGYNMVNKGCEICSENFDRKELLEFIILLKEKFNINSHLTNKNRIYINKKDKKHFFHLIEKYIIKSMAYKLF